MSLRNVTVYGPPTKIPMRLEALENGGTKRLLHIGVHNSANRNAGDTLLFPVVRRLFDMLLGPFHWELRQAWELFSADHALSVNTEFDGVIVGGGGLLLRDQDGSDVSNSGWQWNSTVAAIDSLQAPLVIFAIGYNRFRGQADFDPIFTAHIRAMADKAVFFGLRNNGSIRALSSYLQTKQVDDLRHQYCPTTVIWQLYPKYRAMAVRHNRNNCRVLAFNAAFDRAGLRFGNNADAVLKSLADAVRAAQGLGWNIVFAAHKTMDRQMEPYLEAAGVTYDIADLTDANPDDVMEFYARVDFVFGMRGHAQMIPFGLRKPIMSIISHDKMRYFLEDIDRPHWGVEIDSPEISARLADALQRFDRDRVSVSRDVAHAQTSVWLETLANMTNIGRTLLTDRYENVSPLE